jgi:para-aminobenzoate synthetase/4-amino-4-deoxychorismate lyase
MAIISRLERDPRGIYTGAIGYLRPGRRAQFNVAIRTAVVNRGTGVTKYGIGGGIVWDSDAQQEYAECLLKARILQEETAGREFQLLETTRWTPGEGFALLDEHLARLADSAAYFDFEFDRERVRNELNDRARAFPRATQRVRMLLSAAGMLDVTATPLDAQPAGPLRLKLATDPVRIDNPFLYHKTTRREVYAAARASVDDCDEVLLWNGDGYLTEASIANIAVNIGGRWYTPPQECGLLAGTWRGKLLASGEIEERRIRVDAVPVGAELLLFNSVRGVYRGVLVGET